MVLNIQIPDPEQPRRGSANGLPILIANALVILVILIFLAIFIFAAKTTELNAATFTKWIQALVRSRDVIAAEGLNLFFVFLIASLFLAQKGFSELKAIIDSFVKLIWADYHPSQDTDRLSMRELFYLSLLTMMASVIIVVTQVK